MYDPTAPTCVSQHEPQQREIAVIPVGWPWRALRSSTPPNTKGLQPCGAASTILILNSPPKKLLLQRFATSLGLQPELSNRTCSPRTASGANIAPPHSSRHEQPCLAQHTRALITVTYPDCNYKQLGGARRGCKSAPPARAALRSRLHLITCIWVCDFAVLWGSDARASSHPSLLVGGSGAEIDHIIFHRSNL